MCSSSSVNIWSEAWQPRFLILHWPWRMSLIPPHPHFQHYRLHSPFYSQRRTAQTQLPVFTKLRAFLLFCLIKIKCIRSKKKKEERKTQFCGETEYSLERLLTNILINWNHHYLILCDSFNRFRSFLTSLGWQMPFNVYSSLFGLFYVEFNILIKCRLSPEIYWCINFIGQFYLKVSHWVTQNLYQLFMLICDEMMCTVFSSVIQPKPPQTHTPHVVNNIYTYLHT